MPMVAFTTRLNSQYFDKLFSDRGKRSVGSYSMFSQAFVKYDLESAEWTKKTIKDIETKVGKVTIIKEPTFEKRLRIEIILKVCVLYFTSRIDHT